MMNFTFQLIDVLALQRIQMKMIIMLVFEHAQNGDLHNHLSKNFEEVTWNDKIGSLYWISEG